MPHLTDFTLRAFRVYAALFAFFAPNRSHGRHEHELIAGSIQFAQEAHRREGLSPPRALVMALWEHLGELEPLAMARKTRADATHVAHDPTFGWRLGSMALAALGIGALLVGASSLTGESGRRVTVAVAVAANDPSGHVEVLGEYASLQEAIFVTSDGTICIPSDAPMPATEELLHTPSTPEELAECEDLRDRLGESA